MWRFSRIFMCDPIYPSYPIIAMNPAKLRILFLLKKNYVSGGENLQEVKSGLLNSVQFLADSLRHAFDVETGVVICVDGNSIDKEVHKFHPDICILDALWYTPTKLLELQELWPEVLFVVRVNSKIPFLALEGMSIGWMKKYAENNIHTLEENVLLSANNQDTARDLTDVEIPTIYLPNLYPDIVAPTGTMLSRISDEVRFTLNIVPGAAHRRMDIHIGCFGAIRPLKNQLIQAVAAIMFAEKHDLLLHFHINASRVEQKGEEPLKNIRALFHGSKHKLVEHGWLSHVDFLKLIKSMDLAMQVSYTESFNIVTADAVSQLVPVVVSPDISWMPDICKADPNSTLDIIDKIETLFKHKSYVINQTIQSLKKYNKQSLREWFDFLYPDQCNII